jgi:hypothetical protein
MPASAFPEAPGERGAAVRKKMGRGQSVPKQNIARCTLERAISDRFSNPASLAAGKSERTPISPILASRRAATSAERQVRHPPARVRDRGMVNVGRTIPRSIQRYKHVSGFRPRQSTVRPTTSRPDRLRLLDRTAIRLTGDRSPRTRGSSNITIWWSWRRGVRGSTGGARYIQDRECFGEADAARYGHEVCQSANAPFPFIRPFARVARSPGWTYPCDALAVLCPPRERLWPVWRPSETAGNRALETTRHL